MKALHQRLNLYANGNETYTFVPAEPVGARSLTIYRNSGDIVLNAPNTPLPVTAERSGKTIYGIYGLISLALSEYIIVITGRELRGRLMGQNIYRATDYEILPLNPDISVSSPPHPVEAHLLALVKSHLASGNFLFSYAWDLTRRLQAQWASLKEDGDKPLWEVADDRFFWNKFLQSRLIDVTIGNPDQNLSPYILPVLHGTFDIRPERVNGHHMRLCLISRRSRYRAGTRYFRRGIDQDGHVANFNETEQILLVGPDDSSVQLSFVQIRGSVPVFWAEINTLRYKPDVQIMELQETVDATRKHLQEIVSAYGQSSLVNLVDQKGHELPVKEAYERNVKQANHPKVKYEYFDFHNECKHMRWDRIQGLLDRLDEDLASYGYFHLDASKSEPVRIQTGVVRTNCMDNLDRTNVGQSAVAKWMLTRQLQALDILHETDTIDRYEDFMRDFREMWTDHANMISVAYSGTGALKTDFTRTGQRTRQGMFEDFRNSVMRYLKNNFFDGARQDAYDLMTGTFIPRRGWVPSTFVYDSRPLVVRAMPYVFGFSLFMIFAGLTLPRTSDYSLFYYFLLWFTLVALSLIFIFAHGIEYVNWPRLIPLTHIINYNGPGFRSGQRGKGFGIPALDLNNLKSSAPVHRGKMPGHRRAKSRIEEIEMGTKRVD
ncbi:SacI homology domain-containing protein [Rhodofomes roseus]|uniref:SacI homology domain-containing protein n=1 Tax=Rhodofomes roseus TaxID=34475 RepID=A0ABQ8KF44_9APHY|nr:SacI homology domain-containing protein [Rhodofomes roseus]KAH9835829.1 SacI homology domain-containing protein [Rhodofomes roseus]